MANKNGRPRKPIDWEEFDKLCLLQCSLNEIGQWFGLAPSTIEDRVKAEKGECFSGYFAKKRVGGLISLRRNLFKLSEHNVAAAIFLAKNLLGMSDKQEVAHSGGDSPITVRVIYGDRNKAKT